MEESGPVHRSPLWRGSDQRRIPRAGGSWQHRHQYNLDRPPVLARVHGQPAPGLAGHDLDRWLLQYMASLSPTVVKGTL